MFQLNSIKQHQKIKKEFKQKNLFKEDTKISQKMKNKTCRV